MMIISIYSIEAEGDCDKGKWGKDCDKSCEPKCNIDKGNCDKTSGECPFCIDGCYSKERKCEDCPNSCLLTCTADGCDDCKEGDSYNKWCNEKCSNCQTVKDNPRKCDKTNGKCLGECVSGFFDPECKSLCPEHCDLEVSNCEKKNGNCKKCKDGYFGTNCEDCPPLCLICESITKCTKCKEKNSYGSICENQCPLECNNDPSLDSFCDLENGNCFKCLDKKYGPKCQETCSDINCKVCHKETGECLQCLDGFYLNEKKCSKCPELCSTCENADKCLGCNENDKYGDTCTDSCSPYCAFDEAKKRLCNFQGGNCTICKINCKGPKCELCIDGFSGDYCLEQCHEGCDITKGNCDKAKKCAYCKPKYYGVKCEYPIEDPNCIECDDKGKCLACEKGFYLDKEFKCIKCPDNCKNDECTLEGCKECKDGFYGPMCASKCSPNCGEPTCDKETGKCITCKANFKGDKCDKCIQGKTGNDCTEDCNINCDLDDGSNCDMDGTCAKCKIGFYGQQCETSCSANCSKEGIICEKSTGKCVKCIEGYYTDHCNKPCTLPNCQICNKESGECEKCKETFYDLTKCLKCPKECKDNICTNDGCKECADSKKYGKLCDISCPENCDYTIEPPYCQAPDGKCTKCRPNFEGNLCKNCIKGKHSVNCDKDCSLGCKNKECNKDDGKCSPCNEKLWGDTCENPCPVECNTEAQNCDKSNGACQTCNYGFFGEQCKPCPENCELICDFNTGDCKECKNRHWGPKCDKDCSLNCQQTCAKETGNCDSCNSGFYGSQCLDDCLGCATSCTKNTGECMNHLCKENYYIPWNCSKTCSEHCLNKECDLFTGECKKCLNKKWGMECEKPWEPSCDQDTRIECNSAVAISSPTFMISLGETYGLKDSFTLLKLKIGSNKIPIVVLIDYDSNSPLVVFDADKNLKLEEQSKALKAVYSLEKSDSDKHAEKLLKNAYYDLFDTLEGDYFTEDIYLNITTTISGINANKEMKINVHFLNPSIVILKKDSTKITTEINGIIGLGFLSSFGQDLVKGNHIKNNIFIHSPSSLIFGDYTSEIKNNFPKLTTLIPKDKCEFNSKKSIKTTINGFTSNYGKGYQLSIDATISYSQKTELVFPSTLQSFFEKLYFASFFEHECDLKELSKNIKEYTCIKNDIFNKLPLLGLVIDDYIYYLQESDLFEGENNRYKFKIQLKKEPKIVLGKEFLNHFSVVYNQGNGTLNLYGNAKKLLINLVEIPKEWPDIANNGWFSPGTIALLAIFGSLAVFTVGYIGYHCYKRKVKDIRIEPLYDPNS